MVPIGPSSGKNGHSMVATNGNEDDVNGGTLLILQENSNLTIKLHCNLLNRVILIGEL